MKFSYNWLRELVPGLDTKAQALERLITMKTAECEGVDAVGMMLAAASPARIVSVDPIPSSHNQETVVETERYGIRTVVCGAPNCRAGMLTVYVPVAKAVIQGVESDGMLASAAELGLSRDHSGIVELSSADELARLIPDSVIEVDNKSLTHRPDLWGHYGMAREVAAIAGKALRDPVDSTLLPQGPPAVNVEIADLALCSRYSALVFENVTVQPSPLWLQYRLEAIGLNPINNIVDVTNYVMAELSQPMHAFDADKLNGPTIFVRNARAGERIKALNDESYDLAPSNLVIADAAGPVALAGVIGGLDSAIGPETRRIVLESANFQAASVRKTSVAHKLRTDASMRFEKSQDPVNTTRGLARAIELVREVSPGITIAGGVADVKAELRMAPPIELSVEWIVRKLGRPVSGPELRAILESLEFGVTETSPGVFSIAVPSWRATKDVSLKDDLLEEVGRMIGYDSITPRPPVVEAVVPPSNPERLFERRVRAMAAAQGFTEIHSYSFISDEAALRFGFQPSEHIRVANPIVSDQDLLRTSLLPGIWNAIVENSKHFSSFRFFEIGREIHKKGSGLPDEIPHLVVVVYARDDGSAGLFELKHLAECFVPGCESAPAAPRPFEHPERAATVGEFGRLFELHPSLGADGRAAVLDLDLAVLRRLQERETKYQALRRFPTSAFDLSVVAEIREPVGRIRRRLVEAAYRDLVEIEFVRQYSGPPLPDNRKSVSFRLTVGAQDRTLSSDDASSIRSRIIEALRHSGYELRI